MLTERDLEKLKFLERPNKKKPTWGNLKLYRKGEIEKISYGRHKDDDGLEEVKREKEVNRLQKRIEREAKKRKKEEKPRPYVAKKRHKHVFGEKEYLEDDDKWRETCTECGFESIWEEL